MRDQNPVSWRAIVAGGLIAATVDIGAASLINWLSPVIILHAIASGALGKASFAGGAGAAVLGLVLQWFMGLLIAAIFVLMASRLAWLRRRWVFAGIAYGVVVFFVMNYVVVPLSAAPFPAHHFGVREFIENLLAMVLFGLIISWCARERRVLLPVRDAGSDAA
ncbi:MAG: hypothetical protein ACRESA_07855 [Gammaproteobacteria bacterium]